MNFREELDEEPPLNADEANTAATLGSGIDAAATTFRRLRHMALGLTPQQATQAAARPGSAVLGHAGGALALNGLRNDFLDYGENGLTPENSRSALTNGTGLASYVTSLLPGAASTAASPLLAAGSAGLTFGTIGDEAAADYDWAGTDGRTWSDWASDMGVAGYELGGHSLGLQVTLGASLVGGVNAIATGAASVGESLVGRGHIMDDVHDGLGMNLLLRSVAQGVQDGRRGS